MHPYLPTYLPTYNIHTYIHTYLHTYASRIFFLLNFYTFLRASGLDG